MIVILAYCLRDQQITLDLFKWIEELGGCKGHQLFLCHDARCDNKLNESVHDSAEKSFEITNHIIAEARIDGWPEGANYMFRICTSYMSYKQDVKYFLWLEPDAIPLESGWLDLIEAEYLNSKKPFMGDRVEVENIPLHMSGVGVYQNPIYLLAGEANRAADVAWDMAAKDQIVPNAHFTNLIEHAWKHPTFNDPHELNSQISKDTVLFHSSKDGSLIKLLRQQKGGDAKLTRNSGSYNAALTVQSPSAATFQSQERPEVVAEILPSIHQ